MIETLRQIRSRIKGAENIKKITRAMEMVSAAKLSRAKKTFYAYRPYFQNLESVLKDLIANIDPRLHPLLKNRESKKSVALCVIASDTGLCGNYNHNVLRFAEEFLKKYGNSATSIVPIGKEAFSYFSRQGFSIKNAYMGSFGRYSQETCDAVTKNLIDMFLTGRADDIYVAHTRFSSSLKHAPVAEKFLNVSFDGGREKRYILEPDATAILNELVPKYLFTKMRVTMLDAFTSEHTSRMFAMKTATDNAVEMIDALTLARNKARQFAITKEVLEIAMSAEALKG
jgi:F-type H+-transporting ATPase subunit gamma